MENRGPPTFGEQLRRYRAAANLTQEGLAARAGLSARAVSDLERGVKTRPHQETVRLLADALHLDGLERGAFEAARGRASASLLAEERWPGATVPGRPVRTLSAMVGREREMGLLERHLVGEGPPLLLLAGEPGIGKTRLLRAARERAQDAGWCVLDGGCQRRSGQEPYAPLLGAITDHLKRRSSTEVPVDLRGCAWLVRLLPELANGPIEPLPGWILSPDQERRLMFDAVGCFLSNVAGPAGTLLLLDDLQWSGVDALDLLATLARSTEDLPLRVIGAYRDTEARTVDALATMLADLAHAGLAQQRTLGPLNPTEAGRLFDELLPGLSAGVDREDLRDRVVRRTGGVPFFLMSYAQSLRLGEAGRGTGGEVPWDLAQGLRQRVAALPDAAREIVEAAAVIGGVVPPALLSAVSGQPEREVLVALRMAGQARLLAEEDGGYRFAHDLIREVIEADLGAAQRRVLHRRIGEALEGQTGERAVELLAYHYAGAQVAEKEALYREQAADRAWAQHANTAVESQYRQVVETLSQRGRRADAARAREKLGSVLRTLARYDEAVAELDQAAEDYRAVGDLEGVACTVAEIGRTYADRGTADEGIRRVQPVIQALDTGVPSRGLALLYTALAFLCSNCGRYAEELVADERALELARAVGDDGIVVQSGDRGYALIHLGRIVEARRVLAETIPLAEAIGDLARLSWLHHFLWLADLHQGELDAARHHNERSLAAAERRGDPAQIAFMTHSGGYNATYTGEWSRARRDFEQAVTMSRSMSGLFVPAYTLMGLGLLNLWEGRWAEARQCLEESVSFAARSGNPEPYRVAQSSLAELDLLQGHAQQAVDRLVPLIDAAGSDEMDVPSYLLVPLAWAHLELGDMAAARLVLAQAMARLRACNFRFALVSALRVQAMTAMRQGHFEEAAGALEEGLALARAMSDPYGEGRLLHVYGRMHVQRDEPEAARERLEAARVSFRRLGARKDTERVEQALADLSPL